MSLRPQQVQPIVAKQPSNWRWFVGMFTACVLAYLIVVGIEWTRYQPPQPTYIFVPVEPSPTPQTIATPQRRAKASPKPFDPDKDPYLIRKPR